VGLSNNKQGKKKENIKITANFRENASRRRDRDKKQRRKDRVHLSGSRTLGGRLEIVPVSSRPRPLVRGRWEFVGLMRQSKQKELHPRVISGDRVTSAWGELLGRKEKKGNKIIRDRVRGNTHWWFLTRSLIKGGGAQENTF